MGKRILKHKKASLTLMALLLAFAIACTVVPYAGSKSVSAATYNSRYGSKTEAVMAGADLNVCIAEEGMVLLKNDGILPLTSGKGTDGARVSLFGVKSVYPNGGGTSTGVDVSAGVTRLTSDIYSSLRDAEIITNPKLEAQYNSWLKEMERIAIYPGLPQYGTYDAPKYRDDFRNEDNFNAAKAELRKSYAAYGDAAIVVLAPTGAAEESRYDGRQVLPKEAYLSYTKGAAHNPATCLIGAANEDDCTIDSNEILHAHMLDGAQFALLDEVCAHFDNVIVVINDSVPMELGFLEDGSYPQIKAAILAGEPGENGFNALGPILNGTVNPSGRLVDTYVNGFEKDPTWQNIGTNMRANGANYTTEAGVVRTGAGFADYEEGIYVGYRYYETRAAYPAATDAATWYEDNVVYPFGHGLSYTEFDWQITDAKPAVASAITETDKISVSIRIENIGDRAGKDVIELYYTAPYTAGGIEKSHVVLGDFAKTKLLAPGESQIVTLKLDAVDMASYNWNGNGGRANGYWLDAGTYELKLMKNSHVAVDSVNYSVTTAIHCEKSNTTGYKIENQFDDVNSVILSTSNTKSVFSRSNWIGTYPTMPTADDMKISDAEFAKWDATAGHASELPASYDTGKPWEVTGAAPTFADAATRPANAAVKLADLVGKDFDDPLWEDILDELTLAESIEMINYGGFSTRANAYIGKPSTFETDGPQGWTGSGVGGSSLTRFAAEPVVASTWSKELAYELGKMIGEQGLWGNSDITAAGVKTYNGWYAPAMNTHRSPFLGRFNEYYSEDGVLAGMIAANASLGARAKGAYVYMKHFAIHEDGGTLRGEMSANNLTGRTSGLSVWANEQVMREIYFKPFQITVEKGGCMAAMSSFSRIGAIWAGGSYALLTELLRNEWGFRGIVVTDISIYAFCNAQQMIRAGGDLILRSGNNAIQQLQNIASVNTPTQLTAIRNAVKNVLYVTANSNAMQIPLGARIIASPNLSAGTIGIAYSQNVFSSNGFVFNTAYTGYSSFSALSRSGNLPAGLALNTTAGNANFGMITGTPTAAGTYTFTLTAGASGYTSCSATFTITVTDPNAPPPLQDQINALLLRLETLENSGFLTQAQVDQLITAAIAGLLGKDKVNELIDAAPYLTQAQIQTLIDDAIAAKHEKDGCGSSSAAIAVLFSLLALAFVALVKKQF